MSEEKQRILIVDDSPEDIHVLIEILGENYAILAATSGEQALKMACEQNRPDVILLDVMMPNQDGFQTCRELKADFDCADIDVIFISGRDTTEEKLEGYEAGAIDYLIKPVQADELLFKVARVLQLQADKSSAAAQQAMAMQTAMTAMSNAGELGVVIDFMRRSFAINSVAELAELLLESTSAYGLECTLLLYADQQPYCLSSSASPPPLEQELLQRLHDSGRIMQRGRRLILNFGDTAQLIRNLPDDEDKTGRLRDHLAILLEGADARLQALKLQQNLTQMLNQAENSLAAIKENQSQHSLHSMQLLENILEDLQGAFVSLGLSEVQEENLVDIVMQGMQRFDQHQMQSNNTQQQLQMLIDGLQAVKHSA